MADNGKKERLSCLRQGGGAFRPSAWRGAAFRKPGVPNYGTGRAGPAWSRSSGFFPPASFFPADAVAPADYSPQDTPGVGKIQD
jgi:hypothetical protein